ncbi:rhomboid family intramembrane serine protease [Tepidiforma flava]|uniref:Rhomboid family intramembrane serine protease n=1 Tax=Tepidiforma flava TaxID=3004094 RepID=A0ABY7M475_9CHLR|nr:rhomboid family intramembrane serine protease [Tepidiforma flava]WBL34909.1 rhomboid family intramembrane serine protease [Tepidiforma flava]
MIPVGDSTRRHSTPWVTYAILLANVAVFIAMLGMDATVPRATSSATQRFAEQTAGVCYGFRAPPNDLNEFICRWGFQPKEFFDTLRGQSGLTGAARWEALLAIVTALFIHGGWLHILGNMLFLWVFADNIEDRLGHAGFLVFYLASGIAASLVQGLMDPPSVVPVVGASGAVAGVLGAYLVWFPRSTVHVVIPFFILIFIPLPVPAFLMIGLWFLQNLFAGYATIVDTASTGGGVAWFAHIGGFVFGALLAMTGIGRRRR